MVMIANASGGFNAPVNSGISNIKYTQAIASEFNGDGRADFLVPYSGGTWWVVQGTATGLASPVNTGVPATGDPDVTIDSTMVTSGRSLRRKACTAAAMPAAWT